MSQFKHQYVRLEEVCDKTRLTRWDILEAIEGQQLNVYAQINANHLGAIHPKSRSVAAIFDYKGIVQLTDPVAKQFAQSLESVSVKHLIIVESHCVNRWRSVTDAFDNVLQANFQYLPHALNQPNSAFLACAAVNASLTTESVVGEFITRASKVLPDDLTHHLADFTEQHPNQRGQRLSTDVLTVNPTQIRVDTEEVIRTFGKEVLLNRGSPANSTVETALDTTDKDRERLHSGSVDSVEAHRLKSVNQRLLTHPIDQIIHRMLVAQPTIRGDKLWAMIRMDVNHNNPRQYDIDNVISEMSQTRIEWFGQGTHSENSMSYDSFRRGAIQRVKTYISKEEK
ncbi:hypothetical protein ACEQ2R_004573 [Vibrio parahaemolyticus]|uniref:hypothetical protein n=1 Tax=Vibrio parahaemolyticus TaxID=670 RepID=UPI00355FE0CC